MTASEKTVLDLILANQVRTEDKLDGMDVRLRNVEIATAGNLAADARSAQNSSIVNSRLGIILAAAGIAVTFGLAVANFITLHS